MFPVDGKQSCGEMRPAADKGEKGKCGRHTYIIEKGQHCQTVGLISGLSEALVLVRIVMDDMELKDKMERHAMSGAKYEVRPTFKTDNAEFI